jgi:hypothetical protein
VVRRNAKIGDVEFRIVARPASTLCSAQAIRVKGITLLRHAWDRKRRHVVPFFGKERPCARIRQIKIDPAIKVRAAISVTGGMVSRPILMNV